jgi:hypothetical protein
MSLFNKLKIYTILVLMFAISAPLFSFNKAFTYSKGPLYGKNIYVPFLIHQHLPGTEAVVKQPGALTLYNTVYYSQAFSLYALKRDQSGKIYPAERVVDFESCVFESGVSYAINKNWEIGGMWRIISYYGGFLDAFTHNFHGVFGFPNAGRELVPQNEVVIDFRTNNGIDITLNHPTVGFGDIDLWGKYNFFRSRYVDSALQFGVKLPTGNLEQVTGSEAPDFTAGLLLDVYPIKYLSLFFQAGIVVPLNSIVDAGYRPYPMFNGLAAIEISPFRFFSIVAQMTFRTSPVTGDNLIMNNLGIIADKVGSVQTNLQVGVVFEYNQWRFQIYFEEDTFTNAGTDYTACASVSTKIKTF